MRIQNLRNLRIAFYPIPGMPSGPVDSMTATERLAILRELREAAGLSQAEAARRVGLTGRQSRLTLGAWENGTFPADKKRRTALIDYLWDVLRLRRDPARFAEVWSVLEEAWGWEPLSDSEWRRLNQPPPAPVATAPPPFQAPASIPHFVGRVEELQELAQRLQQPASRVALVGMGGVGKTSLAIEAAHRLRPHFPDGVLWADAAASDPLDILQSWAAAFGCDYSGLRDVASRSAAVRSLLAGKKVLLVLDDVRIAGQVAPLLPGDPANSTAVTTRNEEVAAAIHASILPLAEWSQNESRELLVAVLGPGRVQQESEAAGELCSLVHHLPLAVEIAAQFLAVRPRQPLAGMVQRLQGVQNRLDLRISSRDVRTSFAVSWESLDEGHRQIFAALAVFEGCSFVVGAAAAVAALDDATTQERLENLKALSLVAEAEGARYRQHPLLADFAREQLGDKAEAWLRMADHYLYVAQESLDHSPKPQYDWEAWMGGMRAAFQQQRWQQVLDYWDTLSDPWFTDARYTQARQGCSWAVAAAQKVDNELALARAYRRWGEACLEQDEHSEAIEWLHHSLMLSEHLEDELEMATVHFLLGRLADEQADYPRAAQHLVASRSLFAEAANEIGLARTTYQQALLAYHCNRLTEAETLAHDAHKQQHSQGDVGGLLPTLRLLADIAMRRQHYENAQGYCQQALALAETQQDRGELACVYYSLGVVARRQGKRHDALRYAQKAGALFAQLGVRENEALTLYEQSIIYEQIEELTLAETLGLQSLALMRDVNAGYNLVYLLYHLGDLEYNRRSVTQAHRYWAEAVQIAEATGHELAEQIQSRLASIIDLG